MGFVRGTLWAGALVDWAFAVVALWPVRTVTDALGIPIGEHVMYFRFAGLLLLVLPIFYVLGARRPTLTPPIAAGACLARGAGAVFLLAHLTRGEAVIAFWFFAVIDASFAALHAVSLSRARYSLLDALFGDVPAAGTPRPGPPGHESEPE